MGMTQWKGKGVCVGGWVGVWVCVCGEGGGVGALIHAGCTQQQPALKRAPWLLLRGMLSEGGAY
jgi:hypothetical protein